MVFNRLLLNNLCVCIWVKTIWQVVVLEKEDDVYEWSEFIDAIYLMHWGMKQRFQSIEKL